MSLKTQIDAVMTRIGTEFKAVRSTDLGGLKYRQMTQAAWDAETPHPANTVTFIAG